MMPAMMSSLRYLPQLILVLLCGPGSSACAVESRTPMEILPLSEAWTLAQFGPRDAPHTLLVREDDGVHVHGVDLSVARKNFAANPFDVIAGLDFAEFDTAANDGMISVPYADLLPLGHGSTANVAAGVNYKAHAEESEVEGGGFLFPKLAESTNAVAGPVASSDAMLDYEVELAVTFDRDITRVEDLADARAGFFLCIDYTERAILARLVDRNDVQSGKGFPEAKGFSGAFQTGPYMVVPHDWPAFLDRVTLSLTVNGKKRQEAEASMMETPIPGLIEQALAHGATPRWTYYGRPVPLLPTGIFKKGVTLLTGTPEGVIFAPPSTAFIFKAALKGMLTLGFLRGGLQHYVVEHFIADAIASRRFLQPGDTVVASAPGLGAITSIIRP
jgi:2-keto-4-pentenoate hydratase/2-oxohepta-3-ene-1,7-dioic acid hydratase in catechol pathway